MEEDNLVEILVVKDKDMLETPLEVQPFSDEEELISYVIKNYKDFESADIYINGQHMARIIQSGVLGYEQVKRVTFYFDSMENIRQARKSFNGNSLKFDFCLKREVFNRIQNADSYNALKSNSPLNAKLVKLNAKERRCRIKRKQGNLVTESSMIVTKDTVGFDARNLDVIHGKYLCQFCGYILRDPVQLSYCGHRLCKSCAYNQIE